MGKRKREKDEELEKNERGKGRQLMTEEDRKWGERERQKKTGRGRD